MLLFSACSLCSPQRAIQSGCDTGLPKSKATLASKFRTLAGLDLFPIRARVEISFLGDHLKITLGSFLAVIGMVLTLFYRISNQTYLGGEEKSKKRARAPYFAPTSHSAKVILQFKSSAIMCKAQQLPRLFREGQRKKKSARLGWVFSCSRGRSVLVIAPFLACA